MKNDALRLELAEKPWEETQELLQKRYKRYIKRIDQVNADDVFETFMNAFAHTLDPHSSYLSPRNSEEYRIQMSLSYFGIGASLQLDEGLRPDRFNHPGRACCHRRQAQTERPHHGCRAGPRGRHGRTSWVGVSMMWSN